MAEKIKKFFKKKKADVVFKKAGPGYRLDDSTSSSVSSTKSNKSDYQPIPNRSGPTQESRQAAAAALARLQTQKTDTTINNSLRAIQAQVRRELEAEKKKASTEPTASETKPVVEEVDLAPVLAVKGVYYKCPLIGPEVLSKEEWNAKIRSFLYEQLPEEKGLTACLILYSLNKGREKVQACVDTLLKYLENILQNPTEEKYRKIRMSNRIYQDKVKPMEGALELLEAAGFEIQKLPHGDGEEDFLVFPEEKLADAHETFEILMDALRNAEPITLELDRNLQVLLPSQAKERNELPPEFYHLSADELKREQMLKAEQVEKNLMLRTKAMREKDELREMKKYKFAIIRVRFPDGILLQGTFGVYEKFSSVIEFVKESLNDEEMEFTLTTPTGQHLTEHNDSTLLDLRLVPATILNFSSNSHRDMYLKPEVVMLARRIVNGKWTASSMAKGKSKSKQKVH